MKFLIKPSVYFCLALTLLASVWLTPSQASALTNSRINQLEFNVRSLQTQINQLEAQAHSTGSPAPPHRLTDSAAPPLDEPSLDEQFDNLATLVIEINQRVMALENQLANLS